MLRKCRKHEFPVQPSLRNRYVSSFETTQSRTNFWRDVLSYLGDEFHSILENPRDKEADVYTSIQTQGPSTSVSICHKFLYLCIDADLVYALRYPRIINSPGPIGWPEIARKWLERTPESGWPSAELKSNIVSSGCLLVPKGHMGSKREDYEWRISFSLAELKLARSLNRIQREVAHTLKAMLCEEQYEYGRVGINAKLDSYFILNTLFAESETIAPVTWQKKNIASILFRLLDKLAASIRSKDLPHYFVEENNLLYKLLQEKVKIGKGEFKREDTESDEMMNSDEYTDFALYTVLRLRHDPLGQLLQQSSYHRLPKSLHDAVFEPLIKEAKRTPTFQPTIYVSTLVKLANAHLYMNNFDEASIYIKDAEVFNEALKTKDQSDIIDEIMVTKAVCSYLSGEYNTALQLLENMHQNQKLIHSKLLTENEKTVVLLLVRALLLDAAVKTADDRKAVNAKAKNLLENVLSLNSDIKVTLELVNLYMLTGSYPEAREHLMKMEDNMMNDALYVIEPIEEDPETRVHYGEVYAVPLVEEPVYVVDQWEADVDDDEVANIDDNDDDVVDKGAFTAPRTCLKTSEPPNKSEGDVCSSDEMENSESFVEGKTKYMNLHAEAKMDQEMNEMEQETSKHGDLSNDELGISISEIKALSVEKPAALGAREPEVVLDELMDQEGSSVSISETGGLDMTHNNDFGDPESLDSLADEEADVIYKRVDEVGKPFDFTMQDNEMDSCAMLNFYDNQDLINLSGLARAFTELGLYDDAQRVRNRILVYVKQRQKVDKTVTVEALEHDLSVYMSHVDKPIIKNDWENPLSIFSEDVLYTTADAHILDEVLKSLVDMCNVVRLSVNDLYFHHRIKLLKFDGKISEAYDMVKRIKNENLKRIHYKVLGYDQEAASAEMYASYGRKYEPVFTMVSKWMKKLVAAVSRFEPTNTYLESVFK